MFSDPPSGVVQNSLQLQRVIVPSRLGCLELRDGVGSGAIEVDAEELLGLFWHRRVGLDNRGNPVKLNHASGNKTVLPINTVLVAIFSDAHTDRVELLLVKVQRDLLRLWFVELSLVVGAIDLDLTRIEHLQPNAPLLRVELHKLRGGLHFDGCQFTSSFRWIELPR